MRAKGAIIVALKPRHAARPDPSLRKKRLLKMTIKLTHYQFCGKISLFP